MPSVPAPKRRCRHRSLTGSRPRRPRTQPRLMGRRSTELRDTFARHSPRRNSRIVGKPTEHHVRANPVGHIGSGFDARSVLRRTSATTRRYVPAPERIAAAERAAQDREASSLEGLDGFVVRALPYARRRQLLDDLELDGRAWSTPRTFRRWRGPHTRRRRSRGRNALIRGVYTGTDATRVPSSHYRPRR